MLGSELGRGPDAHVMALKEDRHGPPADQRGRRHRPRAPPGHHRLARKIPGVPIIPRFLAGHDHPAAEDLAHLVVGQRRPVGFGQLPAHAVDEVLRAGHRASLRVTPPASSVITAATAKDRIEADIQLAGVKPMNRPAEVQADAHQDT
jgi:hypothetical protein